MLAGVTLSLGTILLVKADPPVSFSPSDARIVETPRTITPLSSGETTRAEAWGLSDTEWKRYRTLMDGIRGSVSPATLSPIEVLGIHARDEAERTRYAERWARVITDLKPRLFAAEVGGMRVSLSRPRLHPDRFR